MSLLERLFVLLRAVSTRFLPNLVKSSSSRPLQEADMERIQPEDGESCSATRRTGWRPEGSRAQNKPQTPNLPSDVEIAEKNAIVHCGTPKWKLGSENHGSSWPSAPPTLQRAWAPALRAPEGIQSPGPGSSPCTRGVRTSWTPWRTGDLWEIG